jgi:hypothetical protein
VESVASLDGVPPCRTNNFCRGMRELDQRLVNFLKLLAMSALIFMSAMLSHFCLNINFY